MEKISITIDLSKIDKSKIVPRTFQGKDGEVTSKDYKFEVVPLKEPKVIKEGDTWSMVKTHFVVEAISKEEKAQGKKGTILGDGIIFKDKNTATVANDSEIPF